MGTPKRLRNDDVDAMSNLPAHVIDDILVRLSLRDAVRTSVLSKEWRYKWTSIPELDFDYELYKWIETRELNWSPEPDQLSPGPDHLISLCNQKLEKIIYQVLLSHRGPINRFSLNAEEYNGGPDLDQWVPFLSNYKVQDFLLYLNWFRNRYVMTSHFFTFQHLTHLCLVGYVFKPPPQFKGFSKLVFLDFSNVEFEPAMFGKFISQCLLLETVELSCCTECDSIEFEGPSLTGFTFYGNFKSICIKNAPLLAEVSLSNDIVDNQEIQSSDFIESFGCLPMLEKLYLHSHFLKLMGAGGAPYRFPDSFNSLTYLELSIYFDSIKAVACALCLVRSSPNLQILNARLLADRIGATGAEFIRSQEKPDCNLNQLRLVEMELSSGAEAQLEFVRYLLVCAGELEKMVIKLGYKLKYKYGGWLSFKNLLKQLPQAYPRVQIVVVTE